MGQREEQAGASAHHHPRPPPWHRFTGQLHKVALLTRGTIDQVKDRFAHSLRRPNTIRVHQPDMDLQEHDGPAINVNDSVTKSKFDSPLEFTRAPTLEPR